LHTVATSLRVLLTDLIDYAGLFPPAALDMKTAVENYARYRQSECSWMLGRFVLPAARLDELERLLPTGADQPWCLSVLAGPKLDGDIAALEAFGPRCDQHAVIDCVETKVASADDVHNAHKRIGTATMTYYEVPLNADVPDVLDAIKSVGGRAKIRTGGLTAEAFPSTEAVANCLIECAKRKLAFKATAGLHHPVRCVKPFTYEPNSASGVMHGFLNVAMAAAAVLAWHKAHESSGNMLQDAINTLEKSTFDPEADFGLPQPASSLLEETRRDFFISFGSCSFEEPIADLRSLDLL
jgi:hypothetical protein